MPPAGKPYDLVIVGGGVVGAGIARDAALRGMRVALIERKDLGYGTSSKSSKLVHGGLRYLEQGELKLVFEGVSERAVQMRNAPHLVRPVPFFVPIYKTHRPGLRIIDIGLWIYDAMAMFRTTQLHKTFPAREVAKLEPALERKGLAGALEYFDCLTDDARLTLENALDARQLGADLHTYTELVGATIDKKGRVTAVKARSTIDGRAIELPTRSVVVAAGPWVDEVMTKLGLPPARPLLRPTKGVHVVVPSDRLPVERAVTLFTKDERVMFALPWIERTVIGTTDTDYQGDPADVAASGDDVRYCCEQANQFFPGSKLAPSDVIATWAGLRPLVASDATRTHDVSREHEVFVHEQGVIVIAGGKLTTYRRMAKDTLDRVTEWLGDYYDGWQDERPIARCTTKHRALPGAQGMIPEGEKMSPEDAVAALANRLARDHGVSERVGEHLAWTYGVKAERVLARAAAEPGLRERLNADLPYLWAEVDHAVEEELAKTVEDVLARRTQMLLRGTDQGLDVAERVADRMAKRLGWTRETRAASIAEYAATVARSRRFRTS